MHISCMLAAALVQTQNDTYLTRVRKQWFNTPTSGLLLNVFMIVSGLQHLKSKPRFFRGQVRSMRRTCRGRPQLQCGWSVPNRPKCWQGNLFACACHGECVFEEGWEGERVVHYGWLYQNMSLLRNGWFSNSNLFSVKLVLSSIFCCSKKPQKCR